MGKITDITKQKKNPHRYNLFVDGSYLFSVSDEVVIRCGLKIGTQIDEDELREVKEQDDLRTAMDKSLFALSRADKTVRQLSQYLAQKGYSEKIIEQTVEKLKGYGYLNDETYAKRMVLSNSETGGAGKFMLKYKLLQKGVSKETSEEALQTLTDDDQIKSALQYKIKLDKKYAQLDARERSAKTSRALAARGYSWDIIRQVLNAQDEEWADDV